MTNRRWIRIPGLAAADFPPGTPLARFAAWNEARWHKDRRYLIASDLLALFRASGGGEQGRARCLAHLAYQRVIAARLGGWAFLAPPPHRSTSRPAATQAATPNRLIDALLDSIGSADQAAHAALFRAFEALAEQRDLDAIASWRPRHIASRRPSGPRRILVIRLSALGDFVQSLGPMAALRRHHTADHLALLTTAPFAAFATELGLFDEVLIDRRPKPAALREWWGLRRQLRQGRFDRVYDLQTSQRSSNYLRLFSRFGRPEWSGIAPGCSHPHANLDRDRQHTIDKQAEQLLMAGVYPTLQPIEPRVSRDLPAELSGRDFVLLVPGSSPHRLAKRWPAACYGRLGLALSEAGYVPVVIGAQAERALAVEIRGTCPEAIDLVGQTDLLDLAALTRAARLTVGNDTGACHLAAAGGPVVVLFSAASDPALCAPRGRLVRVLSAIDLNDLEIDTVLAVVLAVLRSAVHRAEVQPV
jgi:ADP-heptose:LPS heptosyltransferase